jgi:hypothetical protein
MTMLSPTATSHAELREQLGGVGRALSAQRAMLWLARGLAFGAIIVLGLVIWAWTRDTVSQLPLPLLIALPIGTGLVVAAASLLIRHDTRELARRVDRAAHLHERSTTALELGARGDEYPLALAQMRDAVEHLRRVDMLEAFPLRAPKNELMTTFFVAVIAVLVGISPNPWLLRARASNPAITVAREEAQRVQRLADSMQQDQNQAEIDALRQLVNQGAKTMDARSNEPDAALNALQDLQDQIRQMSAGDDQLASALGAIANALASDPATQQLANAINTGDLRQISQAIRDLAQQTDQMSGQQKAQVAKTLRDASQRAQRSSQSVANDLSNAASALMAASGTDSGDASASATDDGQSPGAQMTQSPQDALNQLSNAAAAAAERQRAQSQLESSRNALERALGRTQSRSGTSGSGRSSQSSNSRQNSQSSNGSQASDPGQGGSQGQNSGDSGDNGDASGSGGSPGEDGSNGQTGDGSGYSAGGQGADHAGAQSGMDVITRPEQVPNSGSVPPDESSINPYLGNAANGSANASEEAVQPSYSRKPTQGNESASIPLGLRDLVKDYFSSLDQK